jgi:hypothetical protein
MCGLPHRSRHGGLSWRIAGSGIYWSPELRSAEKLGAVLTFGSGWVYRCECQCRPFDWIEPLYLARKVMGKGTAGIPIKLGLNSLYGKLAQRIGVPKYGNFVWAGLITALTRARLNSAISQARPDIVMIATDGLYSRVPLDLPIGADLGQWELKTHDKGLFVVQPGLYWGADAIGGRSAFRTRGVSRGFFMEAGRTAKFETAWRDWHAGNAGKVPNATTIPVVSLPLRLFVGLRLAQARGKPDLAGCWLGGEDSPEPNVKNFSFDWSLKRGFGAWEPGPCVVTHPLPGSPLDVSETHATDAVTLAWLDGLANELADQPDHWQGLDDPPL